MAPNDNNEFERKSSFLNKRPTLFNAPHQQTPTPKSKKIYKSPGRLKERIRHASLENTTDKLPLDFVWPYLFYFL